MSDQINLHGKVIFITGASKGIGKASALVLASYGADIVAADINPEEAEQTIKRVNQLGQEGLALYIDVADSISVNHAVGQAIDQFGNIDVLVNSAGVAVASRFVELSEELWDRIMSINAKGTFLCCKAVLKHMMQNNFGKIINVSSQTAKIGETYNGAYSCSKAAINNMTQVLAAEMAPYGITVTAVCPGAVDTEMMEQAFVNFGREYGREPEVLKEEWLQSIPLKRMAKPEEIGEMIAFLASDKSDYITGVSYTIAGGSTLV